MGSVEKDMPRTGSTCFIPAVISSPLTHALDISPKMKSNTGGLLDDIDFDSRSTCSESSDGRGEDTDADEGLPSLRALLKPQKPVVIDLTDSDDEVDSTTSLRAMAVGD